MTGVKPDQTASALKYKRGKDAGLLPEAGVRERLCHQRGIDNRDDAGLLFAMGEYCAGALSIIPNQLSSENKPPPFDIGGCL